MTPFSTTGISMARSPFSETSQVVHFLTRDHGRVVCMVKGAFRVKNNFQGNLDLLGLSRITFSRTKGSAMALLRQRTLLESYTGIRHDLRRFAGASLMIELMKRSVQEGQRIPGLFSLTLNVLHAMETGQAEAEPLLFFYQGALLRMLGFAPVLDRCTECGARPSEGRLLAVFPGYGGIVCRNCRNGEGEGFHLSWNAARLIALCTQGELKSVLAIALDAKTALEAWTFYELFFQYHLERRINAYAFLRHIDCV
jgi:DNA repair protein RecO (recombination protein O)